MRVKQYSIRVFELSIVSEEEFLDFANKNLSIMRNYLLYLRGEVTPYIEEFLTKEGISFTKELNISKSNNKELNYKKSQELKVLEDVVRSGQEIDYDGDLFVLDRINSGAKVKANGNLVALSKVEGDVESNGNFMLLKTTPKAKVVFNSMDISQELQANKFYEVKQMDNDVVIKECLKEIKWV